MTMRFSTFANRTSPALWLQRDNGYAGEPRRAWTSSALAGAVATILILAFPRAAIAADAAGAQESSIETVTVTSSRIRRGDFVAPTPVTTLSAEELQTRGITSVITAFQDLPSASPINRSTTGADGAGLATVNLRGLGAERTLVLINGLRHVPSTDVGTIDLNSIPSVAIGQIDVVTGGASAAWGSDAVAGVVNIRYNTTLDGLQLGLQGGMSGENDAKNYKGSLAFGKDLADGRGHFLFAAEFEKTPDRVGLQDRDWGRAGWGLINNTANTGPADGIPSTLIASDIRLSSITYGGLINTPASLSTIAFGPGGQLLPFVRGTSVGALTMIGGGVNAVGLSTTSIWLPYRRQSALAMVDYKLTENTNAFLEATYASSYTVNPIIPWFFFGSITINAGNPFIPAALATQMAAGGITSFRMSRLTSEWGTYTGNNRRNVFTMATGLRGKLAGKFDWEIAYKYGQSRNDNFQTGNGYVTNFNWAVDTVTSPTTGQPVCRVTLTPPTDSALAAVAAKCVPLNLFGLGSPSAAALAYTSAISTLDRQLDMHFATASISGDIADLWAGPLSGTVGVEYRKESVSQQTDPGSLNLALFANNALPLQGQFRVSDLFAEAALPVLSDKPFAHSVELNAAIRRSDYSSVGNVLTWKGGLTWKPLPSGLLVRAAVSRDVRAPNSSELFAPGTFTTFSPNDPCAAASQAQNATIRANCAAQGVPANFVPAPGTVRVARTGNPNLTEEAADTVTLGIVYSPSQFPSITASVDWFQIKLKNAIGLLAPQVILDNCYQTGNVQSCASIFRDPTTRQIIENNNGVGISRSSINVGFSNVSGVDYQVRYSKALSGNSAWSSGKLDVRLLGTYLKEKKESVTGLAVFDIAGQVDPTPQAISTGLPKWRMNATLDYTVGSFGIHPKVRYIGAAKFNNAYTIEQININHVNAVSYLDLTLDYALDNWGGKATIYVGGNNLLDKSPEIAPNSGFFPVPTNMGLYDVLGRYMFAGLRVDF